MAHTGGEAVPLCRAGRGRRRDAGDGRLPTQDKALVFCRVLPPAGGGAGRYLHIKKFRT